MFNNFNSETFLIDAAITIIGLAVIAFVAFVARRALNDLRTRNAKQDRYAFSIEEVGTTMADGGVRIDGIINDKLFSPDEIYDPRNIFRSNN